ncbi:MAG: LCP family protein, partial [Defluviitaleaceae bacterium]|nr:LCP family protein [Defluviitaleaceae bacterium]
YIVDAVGGIVLDIRPEGMYNNHPEATIAINIPGGRQRLDGRMAEQFVRFRDSTGDLGRIERQQYFMHEFFNQILTIEHIMNNPIAFVSTLFDYIQTDFSFFDVPVYSQAINALSMESIEFHVLEGEARNGRHGDGRLTSFFFIDEARAKDLIDEIYADNIINAIGIDEDEQY